MTTVTSVGTTGTSSTQSTTNTVSDYRSFLKLLVAQMKNQDPTNPMDSTQFVAQLAAFSQVEQSVQINDRLDSLIQASALTQADALIGRTVTSADGTTSGVVKEVRLITGGAVAVLQDGQQVPVGAGLTVAAGSA